VCKIVQQDALRFLAALPDNSVDLAVSSPPYFIGKEYDTSRQAEDFFKVHVQLSRELTRVVKPGGSICWQVGSHVQENVVIPLDAIVYTTFSLSEQLKLRNRIVWTFGHGVHCGRRFSGRHETILWFTKGDDYHFDLDAVRVPQKYPGKRYYKGPHRGEPSCNPLGKNPGDVWDIPNVKSNHIEKTKHPCQFPVALVQRLVKAMCPKGGTVIDPYLGSGSTAVAAITEGRLFVGCDIEPKYVKIAQRRVKELQAGTLKTRPLDQPIYMPGNNAIAKPPPEWTRRSQSRAEMVR
jgi:adenine-specific DNA-methyltransferase